MRRRRYSGAPLRVTALALFGMRPGRFSAQTKTSRTAMTFMLKMHPNIVWVALILSAARASAEVPSAIAVSDASVVPTVQAEGAQIYECKPAPLEKSPSQVGALTWQFREPIATLI